MRPLSGRILVPVVLSVVALALLAAVLWVWAAGEPTLTGNSVSPAIGTSSTSFTWDVVYHDDTADDPGTATIAFSLDGAAFGAPVAMTKGAGDPTAGGLGYSYTGTLSPGGAYRYRFQFVDKDGHEAIAGEGPFNGPDVNNPPAAPSDLSMTPAAGTGLGAVAGTDNTTYTFFATSPVDPDPRDTTPYTVTVWLHVGALAPIQMQPVDGSVGSGERYFAVIPPGTAGFGTGSWTWFVDARDTRAHDSVSNQANGTSFQVVASQRESLSWTNISSNPVDWSLAISPDDGTLSHGTGSSSSKYVFRCRYQHPEGLPARAFHTSDSDVWGNSQTGLIVWLPDPHKVPPFTYPTDYLPHHMVWDSARNGKDFGAATPVDYAGGVWFTVTVDPQANVPQYFTPLGVGKVPGNVLNNYFTGFSSWDTFAGGWTPPWSRASQGLIKGNIPYRFETTSDYRPDSTNYAYPSAFNPTGLDRAGQDPSAYATKVENQMTTDPAPVNFNLFPLLARGGRANDVLDTTPSWIPETFFGTPNLPGFDYWPLINENHSRSTTWMTWDFYIKYYGPNDNAPVYVAVYTLKDPTQYNNASYWQNPSNYDYHQMTRDDTSHAPGIWYKYTTNLVPGVTRFWFKAYDGDHEVYYPRDPRQNGGLLDLTCGDTRIPNLVNTRPTLAEAPTDTPVSPATAPEGSATSFKYVVRYKDADSDAPRFAFVDIFDPMLQAAQDGGGNAIPGTVTSRTTNSITFSYVNKTAPADLTLYQGWYVKMVSGNVGANSTSRGHYYRIASVTGTGPYTFNIDQTATVDEVTKRDPQTDGVSSGDQFVIVFRGAMASTGVTDGSTATYGQQYEFNFNQFYSSQPRTFRYGFTFADNWGVNSYAPPPGELGEFVNYPAGDRFGVESSFNSGPVLTAANTAATLSAPAVSDTTPDGPSDTLTMVDPNQGTSGTLFRFRVKYTHPSGLAPTSIGVAISNSAEGAPNPATGTYGTFAITADMTNNDGADLKLGRTYWVDVALATAATPQSYAFRFHANDGLVDAVLNPSDFPLDSTATRGRYGPIVTPNSPPNPIAGGMKVDGYLPSDFTPPGIVITNTTPLLSWNAASDPNDPPSNLAYQVQVAPTASFGSPVLDVTTPAGQTQYQLTAGQALALGTWFFRVRAQDPQGLSSTWSGAQKFVVQANQPPTAPALDSPANDAVLATLRPTLEWDAASDPNPTDPASSLTYRVEVATDAAFTTPVAFSTTTAAGVLQVTVNVDLIENGHYYWRVAAVDDQGAQGPWSGTREFYVNAVNEAPTAPPSSGYTPADGAQVNTLTPTLTFGPGADPDPGTTAADLRYEVQVADNANFLNPVATGTTAPGVTQYTVPAGALRWGITFWWRVRTVDPSGLKSPWMDPTFLTVNNRNPNPPVDGFSPAGGQPVQALKPTMVWNPGSDPDPADTPSTLHYEVNFANNSAWTNARLLITAADTTTVLAPYNLVNGVHYYWRVRTVDAGGLKSDWSETQDFWSISANRPPARVTSGFEAGDADALKTGVGVELEWTGVTDPDNPPVVTDLVHYIVQLSRDPAMPDASILYQYTTADETTAQTVAATLGGGVWYWRVQAVDTLGAAAAWSDIQQFTIELNVKPNAVTSGFKVDGYVPADFTPPGIVITDTQPLLSWDASSDPNTYDPPSTLEYDLQVAAGPGFASPVVDIETAPGVTQFRVATALSPGTWYWRVQVTDLQDADSTWSATQVFVVQTNQAPSVPGGLTPAGGAILPDNDPTLAWANSTDPDPTDPPATLTYRVQVTRKQGFAAGDIVFDATTTAGVTQAEVTPALAENGQYWWRVQALDNQGARSAWSAPVSFFVNTANDAPFAPTTGFAPAGGLSVPTLRPTLNWNPGTDPDPGSGPATLRYEVQIADNLAFTDPETGATTAGVTQFVVTDPLNEGITYYWQVRTVDRGGLKSPWSAPQNFYTRRNAAPGIPVAPFDPSEPRGTNPPTPVTTEYPVLSWGAAADPDAAAGFDTPDKLRYQVQVVDADTYAHTGFATSLAFSGISAAGTTQISVTTQLADNLKYYWRVRTLDTANAASDWSAEMFFWVNLTNNAPSPPVGGFNPTNAAVVTTLTPTLKWDKATDPDPDDPKPGVAGTELAYVVQLASTADFARIAYQFTTARGIIQVTTSALPDRSSWFWRVQSIDDDNARSVWSVNQRFSVDANNQLPTLDTTGLNPVSPTRGTPADSYEFQVRFKDFEGDPPDVVQLEVDGTLVKTMQPQTPGTVDYTVGVVYEVTLAGTEMGVGNHQFRFLTEEGNVTAPTSGFYSGPLIGLFSISGKVTDTLGAALPGVTLRATGGKTAVTASDGTYTIADLATGTYNVTPLLPEYTFSPTTRQVTVNSTNGDAINVNFTGTRRTYSISGTITREDDSPLAGVQVTAGSQTATSGPDGTYTISGLVAGTYTITPSLSEYTFTPPTRIAILNAARGNSTDKDFEAALLSYSISGTVVSGAGPLAGVTMTMGARTTSTDALGRYSFTDLVAGAYTVVPSLEEYTFTPPSRSVYGQPGQRERQRTELHRSPAHLLDLWYRHARRSGPGGRQDHDQQRRGLRQSGYHR